MEKRKYFISYTNRTEENIKRAEWLDWAVRTQLGAETIMQAYDFKPGENFMARMDDALKWIDADSGDAVLLVLTREYVESTMCREEWTNAGRFIPVRFDGVEPSGLLKSRIYIDLCGLGGESALKALLSKIKGEARPDKAPELPVGAAPETGPKPE
jgi:hypothetical protein